VYREKSHTVTGQLAIFQVTSGAPISDQYRSFHCDGWKQSAHCLFSHDDHYNTRCSLCSALFLQRSLYTHSFYKG